MTSIWDFFCSTSHQQCGVSRLTIPLWPCTRERVRQFTSNLMKIFLVFLFASCIAAYGQGASITPSSQTVPTFFWAPDGQGGFSAPTPNRRTIPINLNPGQGQNKVYRWNVNEDTTKFTIRLLSANGSAINQNRNQQTGNWVSSHNLNGQTTVTLEIQSIADPGPSPSLWDAEIEILMSNAIVSRGNYSGRSVRGNGGFGFGSRTGPVGYTRVGIRGGTQWAVTRTTSVGPLRINWALGRFSFRNPTSGIWRARPNQMALDRIYYLPTINPGRRGNPSSFGILRFANP